MINVRRLRSVISKEKLKVTFNLEINKILINFKITQNTMKQYIKPAMTLASLLLLLYTIYDQHKQIIDYKAKIEITNHVIDSLTIKTNLK